MDCFLILFQYCTSFRILFHYWRFYRILFHHWIFSDLIPPSDIFQTIFQNMMFFVFYSTIGNLFPILFRHRILVLDLITQRHQPRILLSFDRGSYFTFRIFRILFLLRSWILFHHRVGSYFSMLSGFYSALPIVWV